MEKGIIVLSTYPDQETASKIAKDILESKLAACVNLTSIRSIYWWNEKIEYSNECLALFKSIGKTAKNLKEAIEQSHPYEVPEVVEITMNGASNSYLQWMADSIGG